MIRKILQVLPILLLLSCGGDISSLDETVENIIEENTGQEVDAAMKVGVSLGLFSVSINQDGEVEVAVTLETPAIPTPLGGFSVFVEGSAEFPNKKTLTLAMPGQTWIYDLNDQPFAVDLNDVDAIVSGDGKGNLTIEINDDRVNPKAEPRFKTADTNTTIVMNTPNITVQTREIGRSANGAPIKVTQIGQGPRAVVLVGGMHAGFAPGTVAVAEKALDYFSTHGQDVPSNVSLYIIPTANPDSVNGGVEMVNGRINGNGVDINRNWDCNWASTAEWRNTAINPGTAVFSEPETQALRDFFLDIQPEAVIFWEARGELVVPGRCNQFHSDSQRLASVYGANSGYKFGYITGYAITGDVADWLDKQGIAAIAILLSNYTADDWNRNLHGLQDVLADVSR